jgi:hypothetical protein
MQDARSASHVISRGNKLWFSSNGVMQCNSTLCAQQIGNALDATHSTRVAQKTRLTKRGLMRFLDSAQDTRLTLYAQMKVSCFLCAISVFSVSQWLPISPQRHRGCTEISILLNCASDHAPKLVATAAAFGRIGHYAINVEHACNVPQILLQLVVRKLIGLRGNN